MSTSPNPAKKRSPVLAIVGGLLLAGGIFVIIKRLKAKPEHNKNNPDPDQGSTTAQPRQATSTSSFPIKNGSNNDLVKQLQTLLGVTADGAFGPKTAAALLLQTGKTSIATQADFDAIIKSLKSKPAIQAGQARASSLVSQYNASSSRQLMPTANTTAFGVVEDASHANQPNGKNIVLKANVKLSHADYVPIATTTAGYLIFNITRGALAGRYKVDPAKMTVV